MATNFAIDYGWTAVIVDATVSPPRVEHWHIKIDGTGFEVTKTSKAGFPLEIQVQARFNESSLPINYKVEHYPCEVKEVVLGAVGNEPPIRSLEFIRDKPLPGKRGFFIIRNSGGKKGIKGPPQYLTLVSLIRKVYEIIENYATYAESQALAHLAVGLENNKKHNRTSVKNQYNSQVSNRKLLILNNEDWMDWI